MNIRIHRYTLTPRKPLSGIARPGPREGALLNIDGGYADLHPWPELGDLPLDRQLAILAAGGTTPLISGSLSLARADAEARGRGLSLFEGLRIPESHWPGHEPPSGFDTVKVKSCDGLPEGVRIRVDFNARLRPATAHDVLRTLPRERIDFVEDPTPYEFEGWRELSASTGLSLALDLAPGRPERPAVGEGYDVVVHKPAVQPAMPQFAGEIVVTSYMDHPIGQFGAAWIAATHRVSSRCGLFTHVLYEENEFSERIAAKGSRLLPPPGTGIGFDDLLENLPWAPLR